MIVQNLITFSVRWLQGWMAKAMLYPLGRMRIPPNGECTSFLPNRESTCFLLNSKSTCSLPKGESGFFFQRVSLWDSLQTASLRDFFQAASQRVPPTSRFVSIAFAKNFNLARLELENRWFWLANRSSEVQVVGTNGRRHLLPMGMHEFSFERRVNEFFPNCKSMSFPPNGKSRGFHPKYESMSFLPNGKSTRFLWNCKTRGFLPKEESTSFIAKDKSTSFLTNKGSLAKAGAYTPSLYGAWVGLVSRAWT